jgi:opacity protein-like surface antigen
MTGCCIGALIRQLAALIQDDNLHYALMYLTKSFALAVTLVATVASAASAQASGPPTAPAPRTESDYYVPLFGVTAGIAIPAGQLADDHAAGYLVGGVVEYAVSGQPYSLRGEALFQRFALKSGHTGDDSNVLSLGTTIVYRLQKSTTQTFVTGGIAIYNATREGTRPGFNFGTGVEIPLTGFTAVGDVRMHVMLADGHALLTVPLTVGVRF